MSIRSLRLAGALAVTAAAAVFAAPAHAGSYTVNIGCQPGSSGGAVAANGWYAALSSRLDRATNCGTPWNVFAPGSEGMFARPNGLTWGGVADTDRGAGWTFVAPGDPFAPDSGFAATARISAFRTGVVLRRNTAGNAYPAARNYQAGIITNVINGKGSQLIYGCAAGSVTNLNTVGVAGGNPNCSSDDYSGTADTGTVGLNGDITQLSFLLQCPQANCEHQYASAGVLAVSSNQLIVTVTDTTGPVLTSTTMPASDWRRTNTTIPVGYSARDLVGIDGAALLVDDSQVATDDNANCAPSNGTTITQYAPCTGLGADSGRIFNARTINLNPTGLTDGPHQVKLRVYDALGNITDTTSVIRMDRTAPAVAFRDQNQAKVAFTVTDTTSGVNTCTISQRPAGSGAFTDLETQTSDGVAVATLPAAGTYDVRAICTDVAGNAAASASQPVTVTAEQITVEVPVVKPACSDGIDNDSDGRVDLNDPGCTSPQDTSETSGDPEVEITGLRTTGPESRILASSGTYSARDCQIITRTATRGSARYRDLIRRGYRRASNGKLVRRVCTSVRRGKKSARSGVTLQRWSTEIFTTKKPVIYGVLEDSTGKRLADATVFVFEENGNDLAKVAELITNAKGGFQYTSTSGPGRKIVFVYRGNDIVRGSVGEATLRQSSRTTMNVNRRNLRNGQTAVFSGRISTMPVTDRKIVYLQVIVRGSWRTFRTVRAGTDGRWKGTYRFTSTRRAVSYRFRALVPKETGYRYESGVSRALSVNVRP